MDERLALRYPRGDNVEKAADRESWDECDERSAHVHPPIRRRDARTLPTRARLLVQEKGGRRDAREELTTTWEEPKVFLKT